MPNIKGCKKYPERVVGRFELQSSTAAGGICSEMFFCFFFSKKNVNLSKSKLGRGQGVERREEGSRESQ